MENIIPIENIQSKIYIIRGKKVMFDNDLAFLYGVATKRLNEQVRRNLESFPVDFMFQLSQEEYGSLRSQSATLKRGEHKKYLPYVFTEHGILMLSSILKSTIAVQVNIQIMRVFVKMREMMNSAVKIHNKLNELEVKYNQHDKEIAVIFEAIKQLMEPVIEEPKYKIGFIKE